MKKLRKISIELALFVTLGLVTGCPGDDLGEVEEACPWLFSKGEECPGQETSGDSNDEVGDGDGDETGDGDGDGDGADGPSDACVVRDDGRARTVFQCGGSMKVSIAFNTFLGDCAKTLGDPGWCDESHEFGFGIESYEMPAVMACCEAEGSPEDEVLRMCSADLVQQICSSIPWRLQALLDAGVIDIGAKQARNLRDWLGKNQQQCYDALNRQSDVAGRLEKATWLVNGGNNKGWRLLQNVRITLEEAQVTNASLPMDEADYLSCMDGSLNNNEYFEEDVPPAPGITSVTRLHDAPDASIRGPKLADGPVFGTAKIASTARLCQAPWCSSMTLTVGEAGAWTLEELELYADGRAVVEYGQRRVAIDRGALRLYGVSRGTNKSGLMVIEPGDAHFVLSGDADRVPGTRWASNTSAITVHESGGGWRIDSFTVAHVDDAGEVWKISVPATIWE